MESSGVTPNPLSPRPQIAPLLQPIIIIIIKIVI
jgi:hypothetical protein